MNDRYMIAARVRKPEARRPDFAERGSAETEEAARFAVRTLAGDAAEAGAEPERLGILDRAVGGAGWILWPWGCPGCGYAGGPGLCADCRGDEHAERRLGETRRDVEREMADWRRDELRDPYESGEIGGFVR